MQNERPSTPFHRRLEAGEPLVGSFVKLPSSHSTEILGRLGFDFVVIDEEHAPIGVETADRMILAGEATGVAPIVRVRRGDASDILRVLDSGAAGILVPHVDTPEKAAAIAAMCRYRHGNRGFSNTTRAGNYGGSSFASLIEDQDRSVVCIAMIEDTAAIPLVDTIVAVEGLDAIFIGRGDLAVAFGETDMNAPVVARATDRIIEAAAKASKPVFVTAANVDEVASFHARGARGFIMASDQGFLRQAATGALASFYSWKRQNKSGEV
ncbi:2-keto-3-deoxy-L-rhamnonate aldolase RhmA [Hyphomicrobiales bacterium]|nr:2-keto-3-deoxy-L-rhamnonate aldolase RhmA [Hyphomicrobiales bacterium]CAH1675518.1 2-keto-3-deoxy-L-rhamnonate aldolase RhmA [Hyphomicrobiales bacterium]